MDKRVKKHEFPELQDRPAQTIYDMARRELKEASDDYSKASVAEGMRRAAGLFIQEGKSGRARRVYREASEIYKALSPTRSNIYASRELLRMAEVEEAHLSTKAGFREKVLKRRLERATITASMVGILGGIFFLSANLTGNATANITNSTANFLGACLLIVGLVAGFFWLKQKRKA